MAADFAALDRRLRALEANKGAVLRWGSVVDVHAGTGTVRVELDDLDKLVSGPLQVLQRRTLKDQHQDLPDIGEHVACLFSGQGFEAGVVLGAGYSKKDPCPGRPAHVFFRKFEDGTELEYDREAHTLTAKVKGRAAIQTTGDIQAEAEGEITVNAGTRIILAAPEIWLNGNVRGASSGSISFSAAKFSITADSVNINGECE